jgi:hypothetical protein
MAQAADKVVLERQHGWSRSAAGNSIPDLETGADPSSPSTVSHVVLYAIIRPHLPLSFTATAAHASKLTRMTCFRSVIT